MNNQPRGVAGFMDGARTFFEGLSFLRAHPRLVPFVFIPFTLTCFAMLGVSFVLFAWVDDLQAWMTPEADSWVVTMLYWIGFLLLLPVLVVLSFGIVGSLIASPFNDYLSQKVEQEMLPGHAKLPTSVGAMVKDLLAAMKQECLRLSIWIGLAILFLPLFLVPVAGAMIYSAILTLVSIRYLAWDSLDYCMGRRRWGFRKKMAFLRASRMRTLGYGTVSFGLLAIPFTSLFVLPLNSLGGSVLFCKIEKATASGGPQT